MASRNFFASVYLRLYTRIVKSYDYCVNGVWQDTKQNPFVNIVKILNLSVRSFLDKNLQVKAASLTYYTLLSIIPTLALIFAIGRGFGLQDLLQNELIKMFPAQKETFNYIFVFVENYLGHSSGGMFLGIGIIFLLFTLYGLMSNVENTFNQIWGVREGRKLFRKAADYAALFFILPIIIICQAGVSIFIKTFMEDSLFSPVVSALINISPFLLSWMFFTAAFVLIPNTKVKFRNAIVAGIISSVGFQVLQWLFITGQVYVSNYNAIYGSFSFIPLLMVWVQLTWMITLGGVVLSYSTQNIFAFNFHNHIEDISVKYSHFITLMVLAIIVRRFAQNGKPYSVHEISERYNLPLRLVNMIIHRLQDANLVSMLNEDENGVSRYVPATDINRYSVAMVNKTIYSIGKLSFLSSFDAEQKSSMAEFTALCHDFENLGSNSYLKDWDITLK